MDEENYFLKGQAFLGLINYIKERRGQRGVDQVFSALRKQAPDMYVAPRDFKTKESYLDLLFIKLLEIMDKEIGQGDLSECYNFGIYDSHHLGVAGYFISFLGSPSTIIKKAPKSWKFYHNKGELVITKLEPGIGVLELRDYIKSTTMCKELEGFFTGAAKQTKGKNVKVNKTKCKSRGDSVCEFTITWDEK
jgi:predicted hydrocarbon binding protein